MRHLAPMVVAAVIAVPALSLVARGQSEAGPAAADDPAVAADASAIPARRLVVRTVPAGAQVTIDGQPLDGSDGLLIVPAGTATVTAQFDGRDPDLRAVELDTGRITRLEIAIDAGKGLGGEVAGHVRPIGLGHLGAGFGGGGVGMGQMVVKVPGLRSTRALAGPPGPLTPLDERLAKPVDLAFEETPLRRVAEVVGRATDIDIGFDLRALSDAGIDVDGTTVTARAAGLPLAVMLDTVCRDQALAWHVRDRDLVITTRDADADRLFTHIHDVSDLITDDFPILIDAIQGSVGPETWNATGGPGSIGPDGTTSGSFLVVRQTLAMQRRVAGFLARLRMLEATAAAARKPLAAEGYWSDSTRAATIRAALDRVVPGRIEFAETPLRAVLAQVAEATGVSIGIEAGPLTDAGIDLDATTVTATMRDVPVARLLERVLDGCDLVADVRGDQLMVTTAAVAAADMSVAVYPIDRLLAAGRSSATLVDLLQAHVEPDTWETVGGSAVVKPLDGDAPCLVVGQTAAGHRAVAAFLAALR